MRTASATIRRAFTMTELLVVIAIMTIIVLVGIPSFASILYSSSRNQAENGLRAALGSARDAAIRDGVESAAVFFFEPGGKTQIVPYIKVGRMTDLDDAGQPVERDVFAPSGVMEPTQLPRGWMVRGYAPPGTIHNANNNRNGWYEPVQGREYDEITGGWVFPETGFYNVDSAAAADGKYQQSFMVRFEAGTGNVIFSEFGPSIVVAPRPSVAARPGGDRPGRVRMWQRPDFSGENLVVWSRRLLARPNGAGNPQMTDQLRRQMIGDESTDTLLVGSVSLLAVYDEERLASAVGARGVNRRSGSLYKYPEGASAKPELDSQLFPGGFAAKAVQQKIDLWLTGELEANGKPVETDAILLTFDRYTGQPRELVP